MNFQEKKGERGNTGAETMIPKMDFLSMEERGNVLSSYIENQIWFDWRFGVGIQMVSPNAWPSVFKKKTDFTKVIVFVENNLKVSKESCITRVKHKAEGDQGQHFEPEAIPR